MMSPSRKSPTSGGGGKSERTVQDFLFVGLNGRVIALDRYDGSVVWKWKAPKAASFVSVMVDGDRLIAAANGYIYCLDPVFGQVVWENPLKGFGVGITSLASAHGQTNAGGPAALAAQQQAAASASTAGATTAT